MSIISLIIKREFIAKVRNKSFIIMTFVSPLIFIAIAVFVGYLSTMKADVKRVAVHDESGIFASHFVDTDEYIFEDLSQLPFDLVKDSLISKGYIGLLYIPLQKNLKSYENKIQFISNDSPSLSFVANLESTVENQLTKSNYAALSMDVTRIESAQSNVNFILSKSSGEETVKGLNEIKIIIGGAFGYLIMMFIVIYGNLVMRSVIEEKTNRIIEIIISSVRPFQLMIGKIIGTSLAGILQFLIWTFLGALLFLIFSVVFGIKMGSAATVAPDMLDAAQAEMSTMQLYVKEFWNLPIFTMLTAFVLYFVGGYFLYSSFYAAIGAAVDNETDSQQFLLPIMMPLILAIYIGFFTVINDPHGNIATLFSFIPLTSPIVMLMRIPFGVPMWQVIVSLIILLATFLIVVWFASKIYRVGILMYGKKPTWKELYQWLKY
jgi:ABC-2 type transport system permease protein